MAKGHRDNHEARLKRGPEAFAKKAKRRKEVTVCNLCGTKTKKLTAGICLRCLNR